MQASRKKQLKTKLLMKKLVPEEILKEELTGIFSAEATQHISIMREAIGEQYQQSNQN